MLGGKKAPLTSCNGCPRLLLSTSRSGRSPGRRRIMEKRLQEAQLYKEEGNQRYREGKYRDAVRRYHRALLQLRGLDPSLPSPIPNLGPQGPALTPEQENILYSTQTDCYNNLAGLAPNASLIKACLLQMEPVNYERVKEYSQKVLERQPGNAKALYRAGVAFFHLQDYEQAQHYLTAAISRQPKDTNVRRYLQLTQSELSSYHQKEKQLYLGMFG
ncbi:tetratricopeptide repeat protein 9C isoform X1 [Choloepus didactylus]|uniref:tetratricopeptide repeat protein 9C isoform X1 n=1 Tax=Choloepus didactylus TaxID=27675 RepID=UPI00189F40C0|nr:tetratricopeptide repeat protein 9C isoform X1 [Choloepus didactylus]